MPTTTTSGTKRRTSRRRQSLSAVPTSSTSDLSSFRLSPPSSRNKQRVTSGGSSSTTSSSSSDDEGSSSYNVMAQNLSNRNLLANKWADALTHGSGAFEQHHDDQDSAERTRKLPPRWSRRMSFRGLSHRKLVVDDDE
mmetsp:Transcript_14000/g.28996  ORF Transcript_14000/g.28996 Transcript_14000/m.28996 type:complete len:138 (-) Transcript_14000:2598-3011(-)